MSLLTSLSQKYHLIGKQYQKWWDTLTTDEKMYFSVDREMRPWQ
jgi:hypothetical protein